MSDGTPGDGAPEQKRENSRVGIDPLVMWRPIETAPKDGTKILLAKIAEIKAAPDFGFEGEPPQVWWRCQGWWSDKWNKWFDGVEPSGLAGPNYWMPVPPVPAT